MHGPSPHLKFLGGPFPQSPQVSAPDVNQDELVQNNRIPTLAQKLAAMADKRILCVSTTDALSREQRKPRCLRKPHDISQPHIRYWLNKKSCFDAYSSRPT